jgi:hypothetical protein
VLDVNSVNRALLDAFAPSDVAAPTRAYPLAGGSAQWATEVRHQLAARHIQATDMLDGLP